MFALRRDHIYLLRMALLRLPYPNRKIANARVGLEYREPAALKDNRLSFFGVLFSAIPRRLFVS